MVTDLGWPGDSFVVAGDEQSSYGCGMAKILFRFTGRTCGGSVFVLAGVTKHLSFSAIQTVFSNNILGINRCWGTWNSLHNHARELIIVGYPTIVDVLFFPQSNYHRHYSHYKSMFSWALEAVFTVGTVCSGCISVVITQSHNTRLPMFSLYSDGHASHIAEIYEFCAIPCSIKAQIRS